MQEYFTEAFVLDREPIGELDFKISLFTKRRGKLVAKVKSARKILSKLSGHLLPGNMADVRLVERNGLQVVDALKTGTAPSAVADLRRLSALLHEDEADPHLWKQLQGGAFDWHEVLAILGWDPTHAVCAICGHSHPDAFHIRGQEFFCRQCALNVLEKELLYIDHAAFKSLGNQA